LLVSRQGTLLGDANGNLVGIITRGDVVRAFDRSRDETLTVGETGSSRLIVTYPDETLHDAVARMLRHDVGRLPVVDRSNERKVLGYLGRSSIVKARQRYHTEEEDKARGFAMAEPAVSPDVNELS
jgi:CBS domain-containing protein